MKKHILIIFYLLLIKSLTLYCQKINEDDLFFDNTKTPVLKGSSDLYKSSNGCWVAPRCTTMILNICINIIYDQTPLEDPCRGFNDIWPPDTTNSINKVLPVWLLDYFDTAISEQFKGSFTKLFAESSFNQLIFLGDYVVVNVKQSFITPSTPGASFDYTTLLNKVLGLINNSGGLNTVFNHNDISEYDKFTNNGIYGIPKALTPDNTIDYTQFLIRNSTTKYGSRALGNGYGGTFIYPLIINGQTYYTKYGSLQCVGAGLINWAISSTPAVHELTHGLLGGNDQHNAGGNNFGTNGYSTFLGLQGGYGLFGGAASSLSSCNGFDRYRLGWKNVNAPGLISANGELSDISKEDSSKKFILRDFVSSGDVVRIKLPYKESLNPLDQYIWLENHQVGKNNKIDFLNFYNIDPCKEIGTPGIYAYYQVGRNINESSNKNSVYPNDQVDNLKMINAEGNWDIKLNGLGKDCPNWGFRYVAKYDQENPFCGINDQNPFIYDTINNVLTFQPEGSFRSQVLYKQTNSFIDNDLPGLGDALDPFQDNSKISISTNPASVNSLTYYVNMNNRGIVPQNTVKNTRRIFLSGLEIKFRIVDADTNGDIYEVEVNWDNYSIENDVRWTGDIVLNEKLIVLPKKIITLDQNKTPIQKYRDINTKEFSKETRLTCSSASYLELKESSSINLKNNSSLLADPSSVVKMLSSSTIDVKEGSSLWAKPYSTMNLTNADIIIDSMGYFCYDSNTIFEFNNNSYIFLLPGSNLGINHVFFDTTICNCNKKIIQTGIIDLRKNNFIQNETFTDSTILTGRNIIMGKEITNTKPYGEVIFENKSQTTIIANKEIIIENGTYFEAGANVEFINKQ